MIRPRPLWTVPKVQITEIAPDPGYRGPWILAQEFSLSPGDAVYIPVVQRGEAREPQKYDSSDTTVEVCTSDHRGPLLPIEAESVLTVRATARDMSFREIELVVWIEKGTLQIRAAGTPARDLDARKKNYLVGSSASSIRQNVATLAAAKNARAGLEQALLRKKLSDTMLMRSPRKLRDLWNSSPVGKEEQNSS